MKRVALDTNIYVSALNFGSRSAWLLGMAQAGILRIDISDGILGEVIRVLWEDFAWDGYGLHLMKDRLLKIANHVKPKQTRRRVHDPNYNHVIECAVEAGSDLIITNDKAILRRHDYAGIKIIPADVFLQWQER